MFNQEKEEQKLDWIYKGPNSTINRDEYLLGRSIDKNLEQLNEEEKQKQASSLIPQQRNVVEHECIPPSIRDFNKLVQSEQVDLSTKLQEDPLVAIKKREEETRRQFLQNPVQLKKLQKALKAQQANKKKKKKRKSRKSSDSDSDLDRKLTAKLLGKVSKEERNIDIILMHKYEALKDKINKSDLEDILSGKFTDSDSSDSEEEASKRPKNKSETHHKKYDIGDKKSEFRKNQNLRYNREYMRGSERRNDEYRHERRIKDTHRKQSSSSSESENEKKISRYQYDSDDSEQSKKTKINYGLVSSNGKKITLSGKYDHKDNVGQRPKLKSTVSQPPLQQHTAKHMSDKDKEKLRQEMMQNALQRDKERSINLKQFREQEEKEKKEQMYDSEFIHKQLLRSANHSSVESRIKSNVNNIQRSSRDMNKHFSRRQ